MFEGFAKGRARKNRWKAPMLASGAMVHVAVFTGMWVHGMWDIKKVEAASESLTMVTMAEIPRVEEPGPAAKPKESEKVPPKRVAKGPTQPEKKPETPPEVPITTGNEELPPGGNPDVDGIPTDGPPTTKSLPPVELPKPPVAPPRPPVVKPVTPTVLPSALIRISGEKVILPDAETAQQIARGDTKQVRGTVRLCLGADGSVQSTSLLRSTQFTAYDEKLEREMRNWRYQPHQVNGVATPVCTSITVIYQQR